MTGASSCHFSRGIHVSRTAGIQRTNNSSMYLSDGHSLSSNILNLMLSYTDRRQHLWHRPQMTILWWFRCLGPRLVSMIEMQGIRVGYHCMEMTLFDCVLHTLLIGHLIFFAINVYGWHFYAIVDSVLMEMHKIIQRSYLYFYRLLTLSWKLL